MQSPNGWRKMVAVWLEELFTPPSSNLQSSVLPLKNTLLKIHVLDRLWKYTFGEKQAFLESYFKKYTSFWKKYTFKKYTFEGGKCTSNNTFLKNLFDNTIENMHFWKMSDPSFLHQVQRAIYNHLSCTRPGHLGVPSPTPGSVTDPPGGEGTPTSSLPKECGFKIWT